MLPFLSIVSIGDYLPENTVYRSSLLVVDYQGRQKNQAFFLVGKKCRDVH
jgi:predicted nucleotidyltransferase